MACTMARTAHSRCFSTNGGSRTPGVCRRRRVIVNASTDVPPNVAEAKAWVAAWRAKHNQQPTAAASNGNGNGAGAAPPAPAAPNRSKFGAATAMADGTLIFTADQLASVDYSDINLKGKK